MVWEASVVDFRHRSREFPGRLGNVAKIVQTNWLEHIELDGFWVVVALFGLGLAVVRGTGPKFHYRPLFGHIGPPEPKTRHFGVSGVTKWWTIRFWLQMEPVNASFGLESVFFFDFLNL